MSLFALFRLYLTPFSGWPGLHYFGLVLLPIVLITGLLTQKFAFGLAVWDYVMLVAVPFALAPKVLRSLICNRRLLLVPGFARQALLAALLFTALQSLFIAVFAEGYGVPGQHWHNAGNLFVVCSVYVVVMQHAITTRWAMAILSTFPIVIMAAVLFSLQGYGRRWLGNDHVLWLVGATLLGWLLALRRVGNDHSFKPEHDSVLHLRSADMQRGQAGHWLLMGGNPMTHPDATLLLGYPATTGVRLRLLSWQVLLGPALGTLLLALMTELNFDRHWTFKPGIADMFMLSSLFPATFAAYSNVEWVARLRLLWLRGTEHRYQLWLLLERQVWVNVALVLVLSVALTSIGLVFAQVPAAVMLHFPLLVLVFNALYSYYSICARCASWSRMYGLLLSFAGSGLMFAGVWLAIRNGLQWPLYMLELVVLVSAIALRLLARRGVVRVDWLQVTPLRTSHPWQTQ